MPEFDPIRRQILPDRTTSASENSGPIVAGSHSRTEQPGQSGPPGGPGPSLASAAATRRRSTDFLPWADQVERVSSGRPAAAFDARPRPIGSGKHRGDIGARKRRRTGVDTDRAAGTGRDNDADEPTASEPVVVPAFGRPHRVVVVGAGFSGIAAALELQRLGVEVVVLEVRGEGAVARERSRQLY